MMKIYKDWELSQPIETLDLGIVQVGDSKDYTFYIHNEWNPDWGGETLIDTQRGLPLVSYPNPNILLTIKNGVRHKVCPITGPKKRKVLQIRGIFYE